MIRKLRASDMQAVLAIWLEGNLQAHPFISASYWKDNQPFVAEALPKAEVYIYERKGEIIAFAGLQGNHIAGLFVRQKDRSKGIGHALMAYLQQRHKTLTLCVYEKNERALKFYREKGFQATQKRQDNANGEYEYIMDWTAKSEPENGSTAAAPKQ